MWNCTVTATTALIYTHFYKHVSSIIIALLQVNTTFALCLIDVVTHALKKITRKGIIISKLTSNS